MNAPIPPIWTLGSTEVFKTGTWRAALPQHISAPSPCHGACPVNGEIAQWIGRAREGDWRGAWDILTCHNPFPAVAGRICHHPCEAACNRAAFDEALAICRLERYVGDHAIEQHWAFAPAPMQRSERIAVVGGGPAGLSAAYQLRRRGYAVTLFESRPQLGGLMRYGIPSYRLARAVLDAEIARIVALGIDVRCGEPLATPHELEQMRRAFDAVFVAVGAQRQKRLPQLNYAMPWVLDGAAYLERANAGAPPALGKRVVVIGGGSAALDAARSAQRAGHEVTLLALESRAQMPAQRDEVTEALEEGIALRDASMLNGASELDGAGLRLACVRVRFEPLAQRGQFSVTPLAGSEFTLEADAIIASIGQDADLAALRGVVASTGGVLHVDSSQATSLERVYAGGDVASNARFVTEAVGMGKRAALAIDRALRGSQSDSVDDADGTEPVVKLGAISTFYYPKQARTAEPRLAAARRFIGDMEVQLGIDAGQALAEAQRCFSCGSCIHCDNCVVYCPDLAVKRTADGYAVLTDYCKGCGLCVKECPTGSMKMVEEAR